MPKPGRYERQTAALEIIGEASHNIERDHAEFAAAHPDLPLAFAYQMRNAVAHGYFKVGLEIVWRTVQNDLTGLHAQVQEIRQKLLEDDSTGDT